MGADVVGGREGQGGAVPERCVVAGVVVGVADEDIEGDPGEEFPERGGGVREAGADLGGEVGVGAVAAGHSVGVVQAEQGERRVHQAPVPLGGAVEAFHEQHVPEPTRTWCEP